MTPRLPPPPEHVAPSVDPVRLFERTERVFEGMFTLEQLVSASAQRALFLARHAVLKRQVALRLHFDPDAPGRRWFERETECLARLDHPGIRTVHSAGYRERWAYRVSKWIDGESLEEVMVRGPRPVPEVLQMARDLIAALDYAHGEGVVIRRIAPTSLMFTRAQRAIITDVRWANRLLAVAEEEPEHHYEAFMAPEARGGRPGNPSGDLYTAAALLYYAVTAVRLPADPLEITPPTELRPACPRVLERVVMHALQAEPNTRYLTAAEMGDDLLADLGEFEYHTTVAPAIAVDDDPSEWEQVLRRALGDDYELLGTLGSGGFGRVYHVRDLTLERDVALKVLHPWLTIDPGVIERFRREARLAAQVRHPHIVDVYDAGGRAGLLWYTMAFVRGENLEQLVTRSGPLPVHRVTQLLEQALSALGHAHAQGLVHRDLKPANLLIEMPAWNLRITDFGLAVAFAGARLDERSPSRSGTPEFAAPEQLLGESVDARTDLYSLALVALYALTGESPFGRGPPEAVLARQQAGRLPDLRRHRSDVPPALRSTLERAAARDPTDRFATADAFLDAMGARRGGARGLLGRLRRAFRE